MSSLFCRHNRFTADCPICSKDSVLSREPTERSAPPKPSKPASGSRRGRSGRTADAPARTFVGPHVSTDPIEHEARTFEVRLEKVPGGLRLAEWRGGALEKRAPVLPASALRQLIDEAVGRSLVSFDLPERSDEGDDASAASAGQAGDMREELRVERIPDPGMVRVARFIYWPGDDRWELQESPVLLPERRFEEALTQAARAGLL